MSKNNATKRKGGAAVRSTDGLGHWLDLRKHKPEPGSRVLVCDEYGYVTIEDVNEVNNVHVGKMTWLQSWKFGNGTKLVAWMPIPEWPRELCHEDADGEMP